MTAPPFLIDGAERPGRWLVTCDHAANRVPPEVAERLIVFGFFNDVLDRMPRGFDADPLRAAVAAKLAAEVA